MNALRAALTEPKQQQKQQLRMQEKKSIAKFRRRCLVFNIEVPKIQGCNRRLTLPTFVKSYCL